MIQDIYNHVKGCRIIDTHEHLPFFERQRPRNDVVTEFLTHYLSSDLVSAGLSRSDLAKARGNELSVEEKWELIGEYFDVCRYTGYAQALETAARDIYGVGYIGKETISALNDAYQGSFRENHYHKILKKYSNIQISIVDSRDTWSDMKYDKEYFILANRINSLIRPSGGSDLEMLEKLTGITVSRFEDYLTACGKRIDQFFECSRILKLSTAYNCSLHFPRVTRQQAEESFNKLFYSGYYIDRRERTFSCDTAFTSYILRFILGLAQDKGMVVQIHTGLQEGNGNLLGNSDPSNLNELFLDYPGVTFDIFHMGYPFQGQLGTLCKMFPNVFADMCWAHIISPVAARRTLSEWLELIPYTKICGFGGDYEPIDGVYGHQYIARRNIAEVLSEKVEAGLFKEETACRIAEALLYDNPKKIFGVE